MFTMVIICLLLLVDITIGGTSHILAKVCLTWKIKSDLLVLGCKTDNLDYSITFFDPVEMEKAYCLPHTCHSYIDAFISQNFTSNETFLSIPLGVDAEKFNGWWNCRYGSSNGKAMVEITLSNFSFVEKKDMLLSSKILITILAVISFVLFSIVCFCLYRNKNRSHQDIIEETDRLHQDIIEETDRLHQDIIEETDLFHRVDNEESV